MNKVDAWSNLLGACKIHPNLELDEISLVAPFIDDNAHGAQNKFK